MMKTMDFSEILFRITMRFYRIRPFRAIFSYPAGAEKIEKIWWPQNGRTDLYTFGGFQLQPGITTREEFQEEIDKAGIIKSRKTLKGDISDIYELQGGKAEIIEFLVKEGSRLIGSSLRDTNLPENSIIGAVVRDAKVLTPTGDTVMEANDKVVMCVLHEAIHELEEFLFDDNELI